MSHRGHIIPAFFRARERDVRRVIKSPAVYTLLNAALVALTGG